MGNNLSTKSKFGIAFVVIGFICPVFGFAVPLLNLSDGLTTTLVAFFMVGGPEVFLILGTALAGKQGVTIVQNKVKRAFGLPEGRYPAGKRQYETGVILIGLWFVLTIYSGYSSILQEEFVQNNMLWFAIGTDILLILGIFVFGGNQMISKIASVFKWEEWKLPEEKEDVNK